MAILYQARYFRLSHISPERDMLLMSSREIEHVSGCQIAKSDIGGNARIIQEMVISPRVFASILETGYLKLTSFFSRVNTLY